MLPTIDSHQAPRLPDADAIHWVWRFATQNHDYAILLLDADRVVRWANAGAAWILGAPVERLVGHTLERYFTDEDLALGIPQLELDGAQAKGSNDDDRWMVRFDGACFWSAGRTAVLHDDAGATLFIKVFRDFTDTKMRIRGLANQAATLAAQNDVRATAIATLAHELRNPLAAVAMAGTVLQLQYRNGEGEPQRPLEIIERNVAFASRLIQDMDEVLRIEAGKVELQLEPLLLHEELQVALDNVLHRTDRGERRIELLLPHGERPIVFEGDRTRLQQVLVNLIGNAIKFTSDQGHVWVTGTTGNQQVVVRIADDGMGISPDMLEAIFGLLTQAQTPAAPAGFGIGLALVKRIVEMHGGSVQALSAGLGRGSEFIVRLPLRPPAATYRPGPG